MRGGKMTEMVKNSLTCLLKELKVPLVAGRMGADYRLRFAFYDKREAVEFRELLFAEIGLTKVHEVINITVHCHIIEITWHEHERDYLIKNIERYLQEDNMGPTNINGENTKFYAIVTDENGKKTAYEITHSSLESNLEWSCSGSYVHHTLRFDREDMRKCDCVFTEWVKEKDELEKLRAENENLKAQLGKCKNQLRSACEFLNGYGEKIDIPLELNNLDYFSSIVNYTTNGETKRREFGEKVAENVRKRAGWHGVWREPNSSKMIEEDEKILDDAVESAMNPFYVSKSNYLDLTSGVTLSGRITSINPDAIYVQQRKSGSSKVMETIKNMVDAYQIKLQLNSIYGEYAANDVKATKEMYEWQRKWGLEWNSNGETTPHIKINVYDSIKDVKFANPATIVFWKDGTKTVVKTQGDEEYVPEVGLAMCICKKVMGNTRDYYRVFKHWMKKV